MYTHQVECGLNEEIENYMRTVINHTSIITKIIFTKKSASEFQVIQNSPQTFFIHFLIYWTNISMQDVC